MKPRLDPITGTLGVLALASSAPALSQQSTAPGSNLEEIVVTARFREENLQETPIAITALTTAELDARAFTNVAEVGYVVPNTYFQKAQAAFGNSMVAFIRGVGQNDFNFAFEPGVSMYIDDVYHATVMGSYFDLLDLERVEVLRGPQGTLFGRNSIGGAMRMVSSPPRGDSSGFLEATLGDFDRTDVRASYDFAFSEKVFARISAASKRRDGFVELVDFVCERPAEAGTLPSITQNRGAGCGIGTLGGEDSTGARLSLRYAPNDNLALTFTADYQDDQSESQADVITAVEMASSSAQFQAWDQNVINATFGINYDERFVTDSLYKNYATFRDPITGLQNRPISSVNAEGFSGKLDWNLGERVGMKLVLATRGYESEFATDTDGSPIGGQEVNGFIDFDQDTVELQFSGVGFNDRLDWTVGLFYYESNVSSAQTVFLPALTPAPTGILVNGFNEQYNENRSLYSQFVFNATDRMNLTLGLRYSEDDKNVHFDNTVIIRDLEGSDDSTDYRFGVDWSFGDGKMLYASVATGYRPLAYNPRPFQPSQLVPVDGEELTAYELGIKGDFLDGRLRFNTALFYSDYEQRIVPQGGIECLKDPDGNIIPGAVANNPMPPPATCAGVLPLTAYVNVPGTISGLEFEFDFRPTQSLTLSGGAGYTDWDSPDIASGSLPVFVPEWNANIALQYEFFLRGGGRFAPRVDAYFQTDVCSALTPGAVNRTALATSCTDAYELVNARLAYFSAADDWSLALGATNIADKEYLVNIFDLTPFGQPFRQGQPGRPREWYLAFTKDF